MRGLGPMIVYHPCTSCAERTYIKKNHRMEDHPWELGSNWAYPVIPGRSNNFTHNRVFVPSLETCAEFWLYKKHRVTPPFFHLGILLNCWYIIGIMVKHVHWKNCWQIIPHTHPGQSSLHMDIDIWWCKLSPHRHPYCNLFIKGTTIKTCSNIIYIYNHMYI